MSEGEQGSARPGWLARRRALRARSAAARRLYLAIVARARRPAPFARMGVPDTADGRFEMIGIEAALVLRRLAALGHEGEALGQALLEVMVTDLDRNLREMGLGDLSVGRYVKRMTASLMARAAALDAALGDAEPESLLAHLRRTAYPGSSPRPEQVSALARYARAAAAELEELPGEHLLAGDLPSGGTSETVDPRAPGP